MTAGTAREGAALAPPGVLTALGGCCVVLGGLVAAGTAPLHLAHGSWLAAYLVLVGGVAQYAMGRARTWRAGQSQTLRWGWAQIGCWNLGNAAVVSGTLAGEPSTVALGSVLLVAALAVALHAAGLPSRRPLESVPALVGWTYRALLLVLALSIPIGIALAYLRQH